MRRCDVAVVSSEQFGLMSWCPTHWFPSPCVVCAKQPCPKQWYDKAGHTEKNVITNTKKMIIINLYIYTYIYIYIYI